MDIFRKNLDTYQGHNVTQITLVNDNGVEISCLTMGAIWQAFNVPDGDGKKNLLLSFDHTKDYYTNAQNICKSIGRVAGRIAGGKCELDGQEVQLPQNENGNMLHGGPNGFSTLNWNYTTSRNNDSVSVIFQKKITEKMDDFPGNILATIIFTLDNDNKVKLSYSALGGAKDSLFNPTNHVYFNLSDRQDLSSHELQIFSDATLETNDKNIPTGRVVDVTGTPLDFREFRNLKAAADENDGFDDAFVVSCAENKEEPIAILRDADSGRQVTIKSDRNALVMYNMPELDTEIKFARDLGKSAIPGEGIALEAQTLPDAINQENFGDIILPKNGKRSYHIEFAYDNFK